MINWWLVAGGFGAGLAGVFTLEAWQRRPHAGRWLVLSLVAWLTTFGFIIVGQDDGPLIGVGTTAVPLANQLSTSLPTAQTPLLPPPYIAPLVFLPTSAPSQPAEPTPASAPTAVLEPDRLRIPSLALDQAVVRLPLVNGRWDVSGLGSQVGWLEGTGQYPGDQYAMVLAGHMTFAQDNLLEVGAFATLQDVQLNAAVIYTSHNTDYTYTVQEVRRVPPTAVDQLTLADSHSLLLVTCTDWDALRREYTNRLLVRAERP